MNYWLWNLFGPASWPLWLVLVAGAGVIARRPVVVRCAVLLSAALIIVMGMLPTGYLLMQRLEAVYPAPITIPRDIKHIAVLAGAEDLAATALSGRLEFGRHGERIAEALVLARRLPAARLWIVGGVGAKGRPRDIEVTAAYWTAAGVNPARVGKIGGTYDTCGNARGIARYLSRGRILLVTSAFHMPRAMACMRAAGIAATAYPVDTQIWKVYDIREILSGDIPDNLARTDLAMHEYAGLLYYRLTGRLD